MPYSRVRERKTTGMPFKPKLDVIAIVFLGLGLVCFIPWVYAMIERDELKRGATAIGIVVSIEPDSDSIRLSYEYQAKGRSFSGYQVVSLEKYGSLRTGDKIPVTYLPDNNSVSVIDNSKHLLDIAIGFQVLAHLFMFPAFLIGIVRNTRGRKALKNQEATTTQGSFQP